MSDNKKKEKRKKAKRALRTYCVEYAYTFVVQAESAEEAEREANRLREQWILGQQGVEPDTDVMTDVYEDK